MAGPAEIVLLSFLFSSSPLPLLIVHQQLREVVAESANAQAILTKQSVIARFFPVKTAILEPFQTPNLHGFSRVFSTALAGLFCLVVGDAPCMVASPQLSSVREGWGENSRNGVPALRP